MTAELREAYLDALTIMERRGPRDLHELASRNADIACNDEAFRAYLAGAGQDDEVVRNLRLRLVTWDNADADQPYSAGTFRNTEERRAEIVRLLKVDDRTAALLREQFPIAGVEEPITIAGDWDPWYHDPARQERGFYWDNYSKFLSEKRAWEPGAVAALDIATERVVEWLSDPLRSEAYQAKGLVVGYVQSGKTANFTGVLAKAIDAGYRLIIVLTGTTDLLRAQTQRRLDMELLGRENILRGIDESNHEALDSLDYQDDPEWLNDGFLRHGVRPSDAGFPDIDRLTTHRFDYKSLKAGIAALDFKKRERNRPFFHEENLFFSDARLLVVKKNATVLGKLVKDLKKISIRLGEIPALIVDDESDQASVNTSNPKKWKADQVERTAINRLISQLLVMLPRAQYVGYTATPFANVFIDPSDAEDIFPKDFLISLPFAPGYMGASDFHDLDSSPGSEAGTFAGSRECAHVRKLSEEPDDTELLRAMDTFVLTGAVKVFRERVSGSSFRHHTMLIHEAMKRDTHREMAEQVYAMWKSAGYVSASANERLRQLYERDVLPVSREIGDGLPIPGTFEALVPHIGEAVARISSVGNPVIVVNSDKDIEQEELDFDRNQVWRILVGGNKLARGFTIEGLTVSYYRRLTKQADTLMQMGRWFGYRKGYRDLVRLFITDDLHTAFRAIVLDEEHFRTELRRYAVMIDGKPQITPREIPPLVAQHLPWLRPTAANKMYNAYLTERCSPGVPLEPLAYPTSTAALRANTELSKPLLAAATEDCFLSTKTSAYPAKTGIIAHAELIDVLTGLQWLDKSFEPDLRWLARLKADQVRDWAVIFPQHRKRDLPTATILGHGPVSLVNRTRSRGPYFNRIAGMEHRLSAERIARMTGLDTDSVAARLAAPLRGAILVYSVIANEQWKPDASGVIAPEDVILAFNITAPISATENGRVVTFAARDPKHAEAAIIDA
ncbi:Z1 domain-containing protein [Nonomuraea sp. NPDC049607]|uniref:Z1 domain-containing protein n=1 Tax=Nonomuraea sp. NPDC049607 TaxID=3154732 RepID=UPI00343B074C